MAFTGARLIVTLSLTRITPEGEEVFRELLERADSAARDTVLSNSRILPGQS